MDIYLEVRKGRVGGRLVSVKCLLHKLEDLSLDL